MELVLVLIELLDVLGRVGLHLGHPLHALVLGPGKADLLAVVPSLHAPVHVQIIVLNDAQDDVGSRDALRSLSRHELSCFLDLCIDIALANAAVG